MDSSRRKESANDVEIFYARTANTWQSIRDVVQHVVVITHLNPIKIQIIKFVEKFFKFIETSSEDFNDY